MSWGCAGAACTPAGGPDESQGLAMEADAEHVDS